MKTLITRAAAHLEGRRGQRAHRNIVDNVFDTRTRLDASVVAMQAEIKSNSAQIAALHTRNDELRRSSKHAQSVAARIAEFFLPR